MPSASSAEFAQFTANLLEQLVPLMRDQLGPFLVKYLGWTGFFEGANFGVGLLTASEMLDNPSRIVENRDLR